MNDQPLDRDQIRKLVSTIFADDLHATHVASLAGAAVGVLEGAALGIYAIGNALAVAEGLKSKHAVKRVDRLLSNEGIPVWSPIAGWVPCILGDRSETSRRSTGPTGELADAIPGTADNTTLGPVTSPSWHRCQAD